MSVPNSFSEGLQEVAKFLDLADRLANTVLDVPLGSDVQDDLRSMALWMNDHPNALVSQANDYFLSLLEARAGAAQELEERGLHQVELEEHEREQR